MHYVVGLNMKFLIVLFFIVSSFAIGTSAAVTMSRPRSMAGNHHIKLLTYRPGGVHYYKGFYGFESSIIFQEDEQFELIAMGDPKGWQIHTIENRLFLKPLDASAKTNATIITRLKSNDKRRVYLFQLHAAEAKGIEDEELAYEVRVVHSGNPYEDVSSNRMASDSGTEGNSGLDETGKQMMALAGGIPDATNPSLNYEYSIAGDKEIRPIRAFDDGHFTYIQFPKTVELPAVFNVDTEGYEGIVNFRSFGDYLVIEMTSSLFSLRRGNLTACLFNETKPYSGKYVKKRSRGVFVKSN